VKIWLKILLFAIGICNLALVRFFAKDLFYDPLIPFYKNTFLQNSFPDLNELLYSLNLALRYLLNSLISLGLIWIAYMDRNYIRFSILLFLILFLLGLISFWLIAHNIKPQDFMTLFYIRRFLIQPLLVIILIPAFYFQNINKNA
jgi:exosortase F-associated protein